MTPINHHLALLRRLVALQAEDPALWSLTATPAEQRLQGALRRLHALIEGIPSPAVLTPTSSDAAFSNFMAAHRSLADQPETMRFVWDSGAEYGRHDHDDHHQKPASNEDAFAQYGLAAMLGMEPVAFMRKYEADAAFHAAVTVLEEVLLAGQHLLQIPPDTGSLPDLTEAGE